MRRRLALFFLPLISAPVGATNETSWNCAQSKDNKEWVCVGEKKPEDKDNAAKNTTEAKPKPVNDGQKMLAKPTENIQPAAVEPKNIESKTSPADNAALKAVSPKNAVTTKTDKDALQTDVAAKQSAPTPANASSKKLLQKEIDRPGWSCSVKAEDKNWDCNLVGADLNGQVQNTEATDSGLGLLAPAFDAKEELIFSNLKSQLKYDPWQNCKAPRGTKPSFVAEKDLRDVTPLDINSDYAEIFDNEIFNYVGNVEMTRADQNSVSKKANYDKVSEILDLQGNVYYSDQDLALHSESASLNLASDQNRIREALFIAPSARVRGRAKVIYRESKNLSRYKNVSYTSCRPGNQDWVLHASELKMDKITGVGSARNPWIEFKGTPVFYSPYLSFPIDKKRQSGFLAPSWGHTQQGGLGITMPYYWNIAPNYDAIFRPRYLTNRGVILAANFRYLTEMSKGYANLEVMPHDSILNETRYMTSIKDSTRISPHLSSNVDLNYASDKTYFTDLGNALTTATSSSFLHSQANLAYANTGVSLKGYVDSYESIDPAIASSGVPYRRLPQVNLNLNHSFDFMPLNTMMNAEYVYFEHASLVNGQRTNIKPSVSFPMKSASGFLTPKLSVQATQYLLSNPTGGLPTTSTLTRTLPIFSTDSGLYMEKDVDFSNRSYLHTLEPRLFYLYIPKVDQNNIPIFDSGLIDPSFNSLFMENRFSGSDRVQDANQVTAAVTTRLLDAKSGKEKLKFSVGEVAYFENRTVTLTSNYPNSLYYPMETNKLSPLVSELNAGLTDHISFNTMTQWDYQLDTMVRNTTGLHYLNKPDKNMPGEIFNLGYRYRKNTTLPLPVGTLPGTRPYDIIQTDVSFHWPVYNDWSAVGRWSYSLLNNDTQESFLGVEKENCCWTFRFIGRHWVNGVTLLANNASTPANTIVNATGVSQTGVFFEIELKGLSSFGGKLDTFFEKQIYGYRKTQQ